MLVCSFMAGIMCFLHFGPDYMKHRIKDRICSKVIKYEEELSEIVEVSHTENSGIYYTHRSYEEINNDTVREMFDVFDLIYVDNVNNEMLVFVVRPSRLVFLWSTWAYGFYYSEDGSSKGALIDITVIEELEDEMKGEGGEPWAGEYWYRTERIKDNWWFFESELKEGFIKWWIRTSRNAKYMS